MAENITMEQVRDAWANWVPYSQTQGYEEFDLMLAAHEKEVLDKAAERARTWWMDGDDKDGPIAELADDLAAAVRGEGEQATLPRQFGVAHPSDRPVGYVHGTEQFSRFCDDAIDARRSAVRGDGGQDA